MKIFGLSVTVPDRAPVLKINRAAVGVSAVPISGYSRGWHPLIREPHTGAWQRNEELAVDTVLSHHAVYACVTRIAQDIGKLRLKLVEQDDDGIWTETSSAAFSPVLRRPNRFQNHIQFKQWWITSKLLHGNAYALKERDGSGRVVALHLLDPSKVTVLVSFEGEVFYQLSSDNLAGLPDYDPRVGTAIPAREIIHDRMNCLFHPLVGISPIYACGVAASVGLNIQSNSDAFFGNGSNPSGILSSPLAISPTKAAELTERWNTQFGGSNTGRVAMLDSGMHFEPMRMTAVDSQLIEQLRWTAETVCSAFQVPAWKIGVAPMPAYTNPEVANQTYYSDCLQVHAEEMEACLDDGLGIGVAKDGKTYGVELDLDGLLRMDQATQVATLTMGIKGGLYKPDEARKKIDLKPLPGGDTIYMQEQNYSLEALASRDAENPLAPSSKPALVPAAAPLALPPGDPVEEEEDDEEEAVQRMIAETAMLLATLEVG